MARCEFCGVEGSDVVEALYRGKRVHACPDCIRQYGLVGISHGARLARRSARRSVLERGDEISLVPDYGERVRAAREAMGLTQEELARRLKVKASLIKKIESGKLPPTPDVARTLERALGIKLLSRGEPGEAGPEERAYIVRGKAERPRLGDFM